MKEKLSNAAEMSKNAYIFIILIGVIFYISYLIQIRFVPEDVGVGDIPALVIGAFGFMVCSLMYISVTYTVLAAPAKIMVMLIRHIPRMRQISSQKNEGIKDLFPYIVGSALPTFALILMALSSIEGDFFDGLYISIKLLFLNEVFLTISTFGLPLLLITYFYESIDNDKKETIDTPMEIFGVKTKVKYFICIILLVCFYITGNTKLLVETSAKLLGIRHESASIVIDKENMEIIREITYINGEKVEYCPLGDEKKYIIFDVTILWKGPGTKYLILSGNKKTSRFEIDKKNVTYISNFKKPKKCKSAS